MYAYGCPLKLTISEQTGSNITNSFEFGDDTPKKATTDNDVIHTYKQTSGDSKKLIVTCSNPTSVVKKEYTLRFLPRITGLKIGNDGPVKVGKTMNYNVTVVEKGLFILYIIDIIHLYIHT